MSKKRILFLILTVLSAFFILLGLAAVALYLAVETGGLQRYVERRVEQATGLEARMEALHLRWPLRVVADGISLGVPGEKREPLLVAKKLEVKTTVGALLRRQFVLVELISPQVVLNEEDLKLLEQKFSPAEGSSGGFSAGLIRIVNAQVSLATSSLEAHLEKVNAAFGTSTVPGKNAALTLGISYAHVQINGQNQTPYEIVLKELTSSFSFVPSRSSTEIQGQANALVTAPVPFFAFPPDVPAGFSLAADYLPKEQSLQNAAFELDVPLVENARVHGSIAQLNGDPVPDLTFVAEVPQLQRLVEYFEPLKRPEYENLKSEGKLTLEGRMKGTFSKPDISLNTKTEFKTVQWNKFVFNGITAEIPAAIRLDTVNLGPGSVEVTKADVPIGKDILTISDIKANLAADTSGARIKVLQAITRPFGQLQGSAAYTFDSGDFTGILSTRKASSRAAVDFVRKATDALPKEFSVSGPFALNAEFQGNLAKSATAFSSQFVFSVQDSELSPSAATKVSSLDAQLQGTLASKDIQKTWSFAVNGNLQDFSVASASFTKDFSGKFPISFSGTYGLDDGVLREAEVGADFGALGKLTASGDVAPVGGVVDLAFSAKDVNLQQVSEIISPAFYQLPEDLSVSGAAGLSGRLEGNLLSEPRHIKGKFDLELENGEFASGEFITAAGVGATASGFFETESPQSSWTFDINGKAGGFELLIQTYYNSFQNSTFPFSLSGTYILPEKTVKNAAATVALSDVGKISARGTATFTGEPAFDLQVTSDGIDLNKFYEQVGRQALSSVSPVFKTATVGGRAAGNAAVQKEGATWQTEGNLELDSAKFLSEDGSFGVESAAAELPFSLHSPGNDDAAEVVFDEKDFGNIRMKDLALGPAQIPALDLQVAVHDNALRIKNPPEVQILGGKLDLGEVQGKDLLSPSVEFTSSLSAEAIELTKLFKMMGLPDIPATMNALFPKITISRERATTEGTAKIYAFGGTVTIDSASIEQPFSPVRTFLADLEFNHIRLSQFTDVFNFGTMTGVMEGTVKDLEISQGQPAAFVADFQTVDTRGIPQTISFDAVENISILGTGRGLQATLGRGLFSFIDVFRYDTIGFYTSLKNDNFKIRGKVVKGDTEYFVKGVTFGPSINVINRNPGQTVSFKSMLERISRIGRSQSENVN